MFFAEDRINVVRRMILAKDKESRQKALDELLVFQRQDFEGILEAMDNLPVTIRLLGMYMNHVIRSFSLPLPLPLPIPFTYSNIFIFTCCVNFIKILLYMNFYQDCTVKIKYLYQQLKKKPTKHLLEMST